MANIRVFINERPWLGWALAGVLLVLSVVLYFQLGNRSDPYSQERLTESVTIKFIDTNEEITMARGRMERELRYRTGQIDSTKGITNPKTGQPTGFPLRDWEETIKRINYEKEEALKGSGKAKAVPPAKGSK